MIHDGLLLVDKPEGLTSHDVVARCRRYLSRKDIGHAGTLDPLATGLLVILVGKATKLSDYILNGNKAYQTTILLGVETDTDDITGKVISQNDNVNVSLEMVQKTIEELTGAITLSVPIYSAMKVKGKKLYEKARSGESFVPPQKIMEFNNIKLISFKDNRVVVQFDCSKGSFVRAWAKAMGQKLKVGATVEVLRRIHSEPYSVTDSIKLSDLEESDQSKVIESPGFVPLNKTLPQWPSHKIEGHDEKLISNGLIPRKLERFLELEFADKPHIQGIKLLSRRSSELVSLLSYVPPTGFKIRRVFPNNQSVKTISG